MAMSPTKTGEMREDSYYLIKSCKSWDFYDSASEREVEPIDCIKVPYDWFRNIVKLQEQVKIDSVVYHGRRINDEVELFEWNDGKETPGLRADLERKGLTVRTYRPEPEVTASKFPRPTYKATMGKDAMPRTEFQRCKDALKNYIVETEKDNSVLVDYAILADAGKPSKKTMILIRISVESFHELYDDALETVSWEGVTYQVLGAIDRREVRVSCAEAKFKAFFKPTSDLNYYVEACFWDRAGYQEAEERAAAKAAKKRAKKHRRQMTLSSAMSASEQSVDSKVEDEEAIKARRREKNKAKKMALKEKKKRQKQESETVDDEVTQSSSSTDEDQDDAQAKRPGGLEILGRVGTNHLVVNNDGEVRLVRIVNLLPNTNTQTATNDTNTSTVNDAAPDDDTATTVSDGSDGSTEDGSGLRVIQASTNEDMRREIQNAKGTVIVAGPDDADVHEDAEGDEEIEAEPSNVEL